VHVGAVCACAVLLTWLEGVSVLLVARLMVRRTAERSGLAGGW
jgi:hypothetical protein